MHTIKDVDKPLNHLHIQNVGEYHVISRPSIGQQKLYQSRSRHILVMIAALTSSLGYDLLGSQQMLGLANPDPIDKYESAAFRHEDSPRGRNPTGTACEVIFTEQLNELARNLLALRLGTRAHSKDLRQDT